LALWTLGGGDGQRDLAERIVAVHGRSALSQPLAHGALLRVAAGLTRPPRQLVVVTGDAGAPLARAGRGIRADVIAIVTPEQADAFAGAGFSLFEGKSLHDGLATAYDCRDF